MERHFQRKFWLGTSTLPGGPLAPPKPPGTHLAEEITTECWSEVRILERWAATESS